MNIVVVLSGCVADGSDLAVVVVQGGGVDDGGGLGVPDPHLLRPDLPGLVHHLPAHKGKHNPTSVLIRVAMLQLQLYSKNSVHGEHYLFI